jgi:hypothetical protein
VEYFALLTAATILIGLLGLVLFRRTRDLGVLLATAALYYWSLYGAWFVTIDKLGGFSGKNYHYLETKLFPVALDANYLIAIGLYALFIVVAQLTVLATLSRKREMPLPPLWLRHEPILLISFAAGIGSVLIIRDRLSEAWALNTSAYLYTRMQVGEWFTVHQVLNRVAMIPAAIGFAVFLAGRRSRTFVSAGGGYVLAGYLTLMAGMAVFTFVLGNKNEVFVAFITGFLAYLSSARRPSLLKVAATLLAGTWFLYSIDFFRAVPVSDLEHAVSERLQDASEVGSFVASSNEAYAAHFSMYGVLANQVEPKFAYSLYALACSVVPRALWPDRPQDIYYYYSSSVGALEGQGYSLHQATGWYLNFGYAGVLTGAIMLGLVWVWFLNARKRTRLNSHLFARVFAYIAPWVFAAYMPPLIRAGPEGYKGLIVEGVLAPLCVLALACRGRRNRPHLVIVPAAQWSADERPEVTA